VLLQTLREREPELHEHMAGVAERSALLARHLGLGAEAVDEVCRAAELHDVGKIAIPTDILHKRGPLDEAEWRFMRQHTVIGERILAAASALGPVARIVRASHERHDGAGYPDGLVGAEIPIGARIVALCDAYDAMVSDRAYRPGRDTAVRRDAVRPRGGRGFPRAVRLGGSTGPLHGRRPRRALSHSESRKQRRTPATGANPGGSFLRMLATAWRKTPKSSSASSR
jgi:response regulator RpfG family c-di-GMP phosphodiesterase